MALTCVPALAETAAGANVPVGYRLVAENSQFNLYLLEETMAVCIENKANGQVVYSTVQNPNTGNKTWKGFYQSGIVIEYIEDVQDKPLQADFINNANEITYEYVDNGFNARVNYTDLGISFDVQVWMDEAGMHVHVPTDTIEEVKDDTYVVVQSAEGVLSRIATQKYTKIEDTNEYVMTDKAGKQHVLSKTSYVGFKDGKLTLKDVAGGTYTVPLEDGALDIMVNAADGKTIRALDVKSVKLSKDKTSIEVTMKDGAKHTLDKSACTFDKDGKLTVTGGAVSVKDTTNKPITLPFANPAASTVLSDGKSGAVLLEDVVSITVNAYKTGKKADGSELKIPVDQVKEISQSSYVLSGVYVYPYMAHSRAGEGQGYMIIPDGQGALVGFENNEGRYTAPYDKNVYGQSIGVSEMARSKDRVLSEDIIMPVFGMVHTDKQIGVLGVIDEGDFAASIQAYPNGVRNLPFDWVTAKYTLRFVFNQPMGPSAGNVATRTEHRRNVDITQHFLLASGDQASYAGLAVAYRNYLIGKNTFADAVHRTFDVQLDFLGMERENYILGKQDVVMTSFDQAGAIMDELSQMGVRTMSVTYRGWQTNGLTGGVPTDSFSVAKSLGGEKGLKELSSRAALKGIPFALEADVLSLNTETHPTLTFSALKKITSQTWSRPTFGKVYETLYYCNPATSQSAAEKLLKAMDKAGLNGVTFTGITQLLTDYYYKDAYHDATEMAEIYAGIINAANDVMPVTLTSPNAYLWPYANVLNDLPVAGSDYTYTDAEVPFLTIALSGQIPYYVEYVNFQANTREFFLHLVEQGARPSFLLTWEDPIDLQNSNSSDIYSSRYELYKNMIVEWYGELSVLFDAVGQNGMIVNHERQGDMVKVTWDNGTLVYLNFGDAAAEMDGVTVESLKHKVVNSNGN